MPDLPIVNITLRPEVDEHALEHLVQVQRFAGNVLVVPGEPAVLRAQGHRGAVYSAASGPIAAARRHPRLGLRHAPVRKVEVGIVAADIQVSPPARIIFGSVPHVSPPGCRYARRMELPHQLPGFSVVGADVAPLLAYRSQPPSP